MAYFSSIFINTNLRSQKHFLFFIGVILIVFFFFLAGLPARAGEPADTNSDIEETSSKTETLTGNIINPLTGASGDEDSAQKQSTKIIGDAINIIFGFVGALSLLVFVIGGVYWVTSMGNEERVKRGRSAMVWAVIGLVLVFSSYAVLNFVFNTLTGF